MYQLPRLKSISGLVHGFSDKVYGNMSFKWHVGDVVVDHRNKFLAELGINIKSCVAMEVSHDINILAIDKKTSGFGMKDESSIQVDGLITNEQNLFLFLLTADCLPIIFYDPINKSLGLAHLSRINSGKKFCVKMIEELYKCYNCNPRDLIIGIGPSIRKESYIFSSDEAKNNTPDWDDFMEGLPDGRVGIDLVGYNARELIRNGIIEENIEISGIDTGKDYNFFSHYRSKRTGEIEGRMATVIGMRH
jgi:polyphenol oxidase